MNTDHSKKKLIFSSETLNIEGRTFEENAEITMIHFEEKYGGLWDSVYDFVEDAWEIQASGLAKVWGIYEFPNKDTLRCDIYRVEVEAE